MAEDLAEHLDRPQCEALNFDHEHPLAHCLVEPDRSDAAKALRSDCDEQLLLHLTFNALMRLQSLVVTGPAGDRGAGPSELKLFVNAPTLDFDACEAQAATQAIALTDEHRAGKPIELKYVLFQKVLSLTVFVPGNANGDDVTAVERLELRGVPVPQEGSKPSAETQHARSKGDWLNSR